MRSIYAAKTNSPETIYQRAEESKERQRVVLEENGIDAAPPSLDQLDRLLGGETTSDELKKELELKTEPEQASAASQPGETLNDEQRQERAKTSVDGCVKELYAYEVELIGSLGELKQAAIDEYLALPEEQHTQESKVRIGYKYLDRCYDLEAESDRQVKGILNRLRGELKELGMKTDIADTLWNNYCEEKQTTKEYYFNKYL